jgi:hypothetical protein
MRPPITMIPLNKKISFYLDTAFLPKYPSKPMVKDFIHAKELKDTYAVRTHNTWNHFILKESLLLQVLSKKEIINNVCNLELDRPIHMLVHLKSHRRVLISGSSSLNYYFKDVNNRAIKIRVENNHEQINLPFQDGDCIVMEWSFDFDKNQTNLVRIIANTTTNTIYKIPSWCE